jgi:hypothetical protein
MDFCREKIRKRRQSPRFRAKQGIQMTTKVERSRKDNIGVPKRMKRVLLAVLGSQLTLVLFLYIWQAKIKKTQSDEPENGN